MGTRPGQTPERLHAALEAYRNLPKMPTPSEIVRAEANIVENTLNLPASELRGYLEELLFARGTRQATMWMHASCLTSE